MDSLKPNESESVNGGSTYTDAEGDYLETETADEDEISDELKNELGSSDAVVTEVEINIVAENNQSVQNYLDQITSEKAQKSVDVGEDAEPDSMNIVVEAAVKNSSGGTTGMKVVTLKLNAISNVVVTEGKILFTYADLYAALIKELESDPDFNGVVTEFRYAIAGASSEKEEKNSSIIFPKLYKVSVDCGNGGKVDTSERFLIAHGASRTIKITADEGYKVADVLVNGKSAGAVETYTIRGAAQNYTVSVIFEKIEG